ncbi:MAG: hypothetical protein U0840_15140 [Gemmataceae bacterium]
MPDETKKQPLVEVGKPVTTDFQLTLLRYNPSGTLLVGGGYVGQVHRWNASGDSLVPLPPLQGHQGWVQGVAFHPAGKILYTADSWGRLCAWDIEAQSPSVRWQHPQAHPAWIRRLAVSPDGALLASCSSDGLVRTWASPTGQKRLDYQHPVDVLSLAFTPDSSALFLGDLHGEIHQLALETGKDVRVLDARKMYRLDRIQDVGGVRCLEIDPTGKILAAGGCQPTSGAFVQGAGLLIFFDLATGKVRQSLDIGGTNDGFVYDLAWHRSGFVLAVLSGQPGTGKLIAHRVGETQPWFTTTKMANCHSLALHPKQRRLVVAATNAGSSGNGRVKTKDGIYPGNFSPIHQWELPA